jgi:hypothetical protein
LFRSPKTHINHHTSPPLALVPATSMQHANIFTAIILQTSFLIIYYFSSKFSFRLFLLLSCIDLTVLTSLCVPRITSQIRQKPSDNTNTQLLHNDLTSQTVKNIGLIPEGVKRPGREAKHSYPVPTLKASGALPLYCR